MAARSLGFALCDIVNVTGCRVGAAATQENMWYKHGDNATERERERPIEAQTERESACFGKPSLGLWGSMCTDFQVLLARGTVRTCFFSSGGNLHESC